MQTPISQNIDYATFGAYNMGFLWFTNQFGVTPTTRFTLTNNYDSTFGSVLVAAGRTNDVVSKTAIQADYFVGSVVVTTNAFAGNVADFNKGFWVTNGGNLSITSVANLVPGIVNDMIIQMDSAGSDRTASFPASFHTNLISGVVTNGNINRYWISILPGMSSNVYELPSR